MKPDPGKSEILFELLPSHYLLDLALRSGSAQ